MIEITRGKSVCQRACLHCMVPLSKLLLFSLHCSLIINTPDVLPHMFGLACTNYQSLSLYLCYLVSLFTNSYCKYPLYYSHIVNKTVFGIKVFLTSYICIKQKSLTFGAGLYPNTAVLLIAAKDLNILFLAHCAKSLKITAQSHTCNRLGPTLILTVCLMCITCM